MREVNRFDLMVLKRQIKVQIVRQNAAVVLACNGDNGSIDEPET